jgi:hypothetical protein
VLGLGIQILVLKKKLFTQISLSFFSMLCCRNSYQFLVGEDERIHQQRDGKKNEEKREF